MAKKIGLRTIEYGPGIKITVWAQSEDGDALFSGRAVWGEIPMVNDGSLGIIREGPMPVAGSADEAIGLAIDEVKRLIGLGVIKSPWS